MSRILNLGPKYSFVYSSEREIDVYPAGHGGTSSPPSISSFTSCPPLPPKGGEGVNPLSAFRVGGKGGSL